jgi:hypothetical protein
MLSWPKIILLVLRVIDRLVDDAQRKGLMNEGEDRAIAESAAAILKKSQYAKSVMESISGLSSDDTDKLLRSFEPK